MAKEVALDALGARPPSIHTALPGPTAARWIEALAATECPSLTARRKRRSERTGAPNDPIVWARAKGSNVVDTDGNVFVDLTAGFSVAAIGHGHPRVLAAVHAQLDAMPHALGDVHPSVPKIELLARLAALAPFDDARIILGLNGSDAIAAALKTAMLATGRPGVIAFHGGYHGLMYGPLAACGVHPKFREPFASQLNPHVRFLPFPSGDPAPVLAQLDELLDDTVGAVLLEPIQGRGGVNIPQDDFLSCVSTRCRDRGALLIVDEIFTGFGRTGRRFASEDARIDILCLGKALGGTLPLSACVAPYDVMRAWGDPAGEAIHTATFAGNPLACAAALASLEVLESDGFYARSGAVGNTFRDTLARALASHPEVVEVRGRGLLIGIELTSGTRTLALVRALLERGYLTLPAGPNAEVLQIAPPLDIDPALLDGFRETLESLL